jgi:hypothetical protein
MKKSISTEMTGENISQVMELLTSTPQTLRRLSQSFSSETATQPLKPGDRSFVELVVHILNCDDRTTETIYAALLLKEPLILDIHPERQWGQLLHYEQFSSAELIEYFGFRRKTLLQVLDNLTDAQWSRAVREEGKQRKESVFRCTRSQALHEVEHLAQIETRFGTVKQPS